MNRINRYYGIASIAATLMLSSTPIHAQRTSKQQQEQLVCGTLPTVAPAPAQYICTSPPKDTILKEHGYEMRGKVFTKRIGDGPLQRVLQLYPCLYRNDTCIGLNKRAQEAYMNNPDSGYVIEFIPEPKKPLEQQ